MTQHSYESESRSTIIQHVYSLTVTVQETICSQNLLEKRKYLCKRRKNLTICETLMKHSVASVHFELI